MSSVALHYVVTGPGDGPPLLLGGSLILDRAAHLASVERPAEITQLIAHHQGADP